MKYNYQEKVSFLVSSCDKYRTAWYPFFSLVKKFWPNHPQNIYLISEIEDYCDKELNIIVFKDGKGRTWSELLYSALIRIPTEYVIFSLEDFFLVDYVNEQEIEKCFNIMESDLLIDEIRFKLSNLEIIRDAEDYKGFKISPSNTPYRVDTQVGLWRKERLINLIEASESAWEFERNATIRAMVNSNKILWQWSSDPYNANNMMYPYILDSEEHFIRGYSIAWGKWLWSNKKLFEDNGIYGVNFHEMGMLSEKRAEIRRKYFFRFGKGKATFIEKIIQWILGSIYIIDRNYREVRLGGIERVRIIIRKARKRLVKKCITMQLGKEK